jgi:hypothetical protein
MADVPDERLAAELRDLGAWLEVPEAPDVRAVVRTRLAALPAPDRAPSWWRPRAGWWRPRPGWWRPRPGWWRRRLVAVAAAVALLVAGVVAVPPARAAVGNAVTGLLRFAGIEIRKGSPPTSLPSPAPLPSLGVVSLDAARRAARFPVRVPQALGPPERVEIADAAPDGAPRIVTLFYRGGAVRLDQFDGRLEPGFVKAAPEARWTEVSGTYALWFPGPHTLVYIDRQGRHQVAGARLAGPTLIWNDGGVAYRLEGIPTMDEAVAIGGSLR